MDNGGCGVVGADAAADISCRGVALAEEEEAPTKAAVVGVLDGVAVFATAALALLLATAAVVRTSPSQLSLVIVRGDAAATTAICEDM